MSKIITLTDYYYLKEQIDDLLEQKASISHSHGNITNEGVITNQINKNVVTDGNGKITTEAKPTIPVANATATNIKMNGTQSAGSLSSFARADHVHPVDTSRAAASHTHSNYLTSHQDISGKENISNKTTAISSSSTDTQYPSAKATYTELNKKANSSHTHDDRYYTETEVDNKLNSYLTTSSATSSYQPKGNYVTTSAIKNDLTTGGASNVLSAEQGKQLKAQIDSIISGETATDHNHDSRYYTESEIDTKLSGKAPTSHTDSNGAYGKATTSVWGHTKLSSATNSTDETVSATPKAVKTAYDLANGKSTVSVKQTKTSGIEIGSVTVNGTETKLYQQDNNTTYSNATTSANGLMSSTDKTNLDKTVDRYDGNYIGGNANPTKPYLRLFNLKAKNGSSSSSHIIFEIIGNNNDRLYAKIRVDMRQNTSTTNSSYTVTPLEVYGFNLNKLYFGFRNDYPNTSLDIFRKVEAYVNFYIRYADDHTRDGTVTMFSPVVNGIESYTDLDEASTALYNADYTSISQGGTYTEVTNTIPYTNVNANKFVKRGGTSSQFLKADGSVDSNTYLTTTDASNTYQAKGNYLTSHNPVDSALSSTSTNAVQNKVINTALGNKVDKVSGKGLSTNDFTATYKTALDNLNTTIANAVSNLEMIEVVTSLPTSNIKTNKLYLKANSVNASENKYDFYVRVNNAWEKVDSLDFSISDYIKKDSNTNLLLSNGTTKAQSSFIANSTGSVTSTNIADKTIVNGDIADGTIESGKIKDGTIVNGDIASNASIAFSKLNISKNDIVGLGIPSSDTNTTYGADRGISNVSGKFGHSNTAITAQTTSALKKIKYDAYGHITGTDNVTASDIPTLTKSKISDFPTSMTPIFNNIGATSSSVKDLNDYDDGGFYYCNANVNAPYITNQPLTSGQKAFFLLVETWGTTSTYVKQTLTYYHNNTTYIRTCDNNGWKEWKQVTFGNSASLSSSSSSSQQVAYLDNDIIINSKNNWKVTGEIKVTGHSVRFQLMAPGETTKKYVAVGKNGGGALTYWWSTSATAEASKTFNASYIDTDKWYPFTITKNGVNVTFEFNNNNSLTHSVDLTYFDSIGLLSPNLFKYNVNGGEVRNVNVVYNDVNVVNNLTTTVTGYALDATQGKALNDSISGKAPTRHASTATTYGVGTTSNYGHVKTIQNLTTNDGDGLALGAGQGKALKALIDAKPNLGTTSDTAAKGDHTHNMDSIIPSINYISGVPLNSNASNDSSNPLTISKNGNYVCLNGIIRLKAALTHGNQRAVAVLPSDYRPSIEVVAPYTGNKDFGHIRISTDGTLTVCCRSENDIPANGYAVINASYIIA